MKKKIYSAIIMVAALMATSCSDFTDVQPKGVNMLSTTDQLELLFNNEISLSATDLVSIGDNAVIGTGFNVLNDMSVENKSRTTLIYSYSDDAKDIQRIQELTSSDAFYTGCYNMVGRICNPVINMANIAKGPDSKKKALVAEAKALRAYAHFMLVSKFAKAYNPATAEKDGGIIYMTEDKDIEEPQRPNTVAQVYNLLLSDINTAIHSGALPSVQPVKTRMNLAAAYALKANILMAMQNYAEAAIAAEKALAENGFLIDYYANAVEQPAWATSVHFPVFPSPMYLECNPSCFEDNEQYFVLPSYWWANRSWTEASVEASVEPDYGRFFLTPRTKATYTGWFEFIMAGVPAEYRQDYSEQMMGLKGWDSPDFVPAVGMVWRNTCGLSSAQVYVLLAECYLRTGDINKAMETLDQLRKNRLPAASYTALKGVVADEATAIEWIKKTSLGENMWSGWNFIQLKRWNVEPEWQTTYTHNFGPMGTRTLAPTSDLWVFPFPLSVKEANPYVSYNYNK